MSLHVVHNHQVVGVHDARCVPLDIDRLLQLADDGLHPLAAHPYHWRHEGNELVVVEDGQETRRYAADEWSVAGPEGTCGAMAGFTGRCRRCHGLQETT